MGRKTATCRGGTAKDPETGGFVGVRLNRRQLAWLRSRGGKDSEVLRGLIDRAIRGEMIRDSMFNKVPSGFTPKLVNDLLEDAKELCKEPLPEIFRTEIDDFFDKHPPKESPKLVWDAANGIYVEGR
jgi:hypothetical protein